MTAGLMRALGGTIPTPALLVLMAVVSLVAFALTFGFTLLSFVFERKKVHYQ